MGDKPAAASAAPKPNWIADGASGHQEAQQQAKVYWRDLDASKDEIAETREGFASNGRSIYWHGHEASEAQNWLADEARIRRRNVGKIPVALWIKHGKAHSAHEAAAPETAAELERVKQQLNQACDALDFATSELQASRKLNSELLAALKGVAGDSIAMRGFHEAFRNQVRAAIAAAERRAQ